MITISWIFTLIALYGTWLNLNKKREGFWLWLASNLAFVVINWQSGQYALALLFSVYAVMAIQGLRAWK